MSEIKTKSFISFQDFYDFIEKLDSSSFSWYKENAAPGIGLFLRRGEETSSLWVFLEKFSGAKLLLLSKGSFVMSTYHYVNNFERAVVFFADDQVSNIDMYFKERIGLSFNS